MDDEYSAYKIWKLPHPIILHWVLNPGLCINEIILGQRMPKITLVDKFSNEPLTERSYVECPHCKTIHNSKIWTGTNTFRHYAGLYCPICEEKIPTLLNVFSILLLALTFPLWKPIQVKYGERFKAWELFRYEQNNLNEEAAKPQSYFRVGLSFGLAMGVFFLLQNAITSGWSFRTFAISLIAGTISGILFGVLMKLFLSRKGQSN